MFIYLIFFYLLHVNYTLDKLLEYLLLNIITFCYLEIVKWSQVKILKISIIIPTRERSYYLHYALQTALEIDDKNIEIIVSDNCSKDGTKAVVEEFSDNRLKYFRTSKRISMRENFNTAVLNSTGDYIIFFGDDDGILPGQFKFLRRILEEHRPDGISWLKSSYIWPKDEFGNEFGGSKAGKIRFYGTRTFGIPYAYNPRDKFLNNLMECNLATFTSTAPNIYHGCVSRAFLENNSSEEKIFFDSTIPDVNFRFRAIILGGNFIHIDHPFSINGDSAVSNGRAHHGYSSANIRSKPADEFHQENENDPYLNIFGNHKFTPLLMMATLETLRSKIINFDKVPNMINWYSYVYKQASIFSHDETFNIVKKSLHDYAIETDTLEELSIAIDKPKTQNKKTLKEILGRIKTIISSFSMSVKKNGKNNILTAVNIYDEILGNSYEYVLDNKRINKKEWYYAKLKAKNISKIFLFR